MCSVCSESKSRGAAHEATNDTPESLVAVCANECGEVSSTTTGSMGPDKSESALLHVGASHDADVS